MSWWQKFMFVFGFFDIVDAQLQAAKLTPVGGSTTLDLSMGGQTLEVSEGGQHWVPVSMTWKRMR